MMNIKELREFLSLRENFVPPFIYTNDKIQRMNQLHKKYIKTLSAYLNGQSLPDNVYVKQERVGKKIISRLISR